MKPRVEALFPEDEKRDSSQFGPYPTAGDDLCSHLLHEICLGAPLPVREPTSFQPRRKEQTRDPAAMWQQQRDDLAVPQREGSVLRAGR